MKQEFVTLPREVVEQALEALSNTGTQRGKQPSQFLAEGLSINALRAAVEQPQNHVPDAGNMVPAGWKLVPAEPNCSMVLAGEQSLEQHDFLRLDSAYRAMLDAAPKPPTVKESLTVDQPQANQPAMTPIAQRKLDSLMASGYTISGYSIYHELKHQHGFVTGAGLVGWWKPEGVEYPHPRGEQEPVAWIRGSGLEMLKLENGGRATVYASDGMSNHSQPLYTHPQPKREPLSDDDLCKVFPAIATYTEANKTLYRSIARAIEAAHNIK